MTLSRMSLVDAQDLDVEEGCEATTTGGGGILLAASQPALAPPQPPSFTVLGGSS